MASKDCSPFPCGAIKETLPKLSILNIVIVKFPLTVAYSRKADISNFPPVIGEGSL